MKLIRQDYTKNKQLYLKQEKALKETLGGNAKIDHVGSTAILNMVGKNIIDILVGTKKLF